MIKDEYAFQLAAFEKGFKRRRVRKKPNKCSVCQTPCWGERCRAHRYTGKQIYKRVNINFPDSSEPLFFRTDPTAKWIFKMFLLILKKFRETFRKFRETSGRSVILYHEYPEISLTKSQAQSERFQTSWTRSDVLNFQMFWTFRRWAPATKV